MSSPYFTIPEFKYMKPQKVEEAVKVLNEHGEEAKVLAGGVGLINFMKERLLSPTYVIDIKGIPELKRLEYVPNEGLYVGAAVTFRELEEFLNKDDGIGRKYKALVEAIPKLSDAVVRNRSTLVGNVCEAIPYMDSYTPLMVYDAKLRAVSVNGERDIRIREFLKGFAETALADNELVKHIFIPEPPAGSVSGFEKYTSHSEYSVISLSILLKWDGERDVRIAYGALSEVPVMLEEAREIFSDMSNVGGALDRTIQIALDRIEFMNDLYSSADYRRHLAEVFTRKLFTRLFKEVRA